MMRNTILVKSVFGDLNGRSTEGTAEIRFSGAGMGERLEINFPGQYGVNIPYRQIERLFARVYERARQEGTGGAGKTVETSAALDGFYSDSTVRSKAGTVSVWLRWNPAFEMLTAAFDGCGQISVPFAPIAGLANRERGLRA